MDGKTAPEMGRRGVARQNMNDRRLQTRKVTLTSKYRLRRLVGQL